MLYPTGGALARPPALLAGIGARRRRSRVVYTPHGFAFLSPSSRMKQLLKAVRDNFDEIYVDLPPTLPFADAGILAHQADGVLMVIRANVTPVKAVNQAVEQLGGAPVLGCVLNGAETHTAPYLKNYVKR